MPKPLTHFFWYLTSFFTIAIEVHTVPLEASIRSFRYHPDSTGPYKSQMNLLSWFAPLNIWEQHLSQAWEQFKSPYKHLEETPAQVIDQCYSIFFLSLNCRKIGDKTGFAPSIELYGSHNYPLSLGSPHLRKIDKALFIKNQNPLHQLQSWKALNPSCALSPSDFNLKDPPMRKNSNSAPLQIIHMNSPNNHGKMLLTPTQKTYFEGRRLIIFSTRYIGIEKEGSRLRKALPVAWIHRTCAHTHSETWNSRIIEKTRWSNALVIPESKNKGIFDTPPEFTQSCKIRYDLTPLETHIVPPPELHTDQRPDTHQLWFTDEDWEDPEIREEVLRLIDEIEALDAAERRAKMERERQTRRRHT
ncbi:hypothetical protein TIFTF001_034958 [Ficus carica]|uniref:Uncharacterized protein n=1 Tax=Ficus carica TaxID=3494 RepID=A0AA88JB68_FICCA|nr:hypothetical protein TIFTF001_034958 [Ficus carica]